MTVNPVGLEKGLKFKRNYIDFDVNNLVALTEMIKMLDDGIKIQSCLSRLKC